MQTTLVKVIKREVFVVSNLKSKDFPWCLFCFQINFKLPSEKIKRASVDDLVSEYFEVVKPGLESVLESCQPTDLLALGRLFALKLQQCRPEGLHI